MANGTRNDFPYLEQALSRARDGQHADVFNALGASGKSGRHYDVRVSRAADFLRCLSGEIAGERGIDQCLVLLAIAETVFQRLEEP